MAEWSIEGKRQPSEGQDTTGKEERNRIEYKKKGRPQTQDHNRGVGRNDGLVIQADAGKISSPASTPVSSTSPPPQQETGQGGYTQITLIGARLLQPQIEFTTHGMLELLTWAGFTNRSISCWLKIDGYLVKLIPTVRRYAELLS